MSAAENFKNQFDEAGRFRGENGVLNVVFATRGGARFPGQLHFREGLCVRAGMESGGDWSGLNGSPIDGIRFLLDIGEDKLQVIAIDQGRVIILPPPAARSTRQDFLENVRIARNLFGHPQVQADSPNIDTKAFAQGLARAAIWLTPRSVAGFNAADFAELGAERQAQLTDAVQAFLSVATEVPPDKSATDEQYTEGAEAFRAILRILDPYLPLPDEAQKVQEALRCVRFPPWVVNWDYELGSDSDGIPAVWLNLFADERDIPRPALGAAASELATLVRQALADYRIDRWPYIRLKTAAEHKSA